MASRVGNAIRRAALLSAMVLLASCAPWQPAPEESRGSQDRSGPAAGPLPAPPIYAVRRGDTLYSIAFRYGLDWRDVAGWNGIEAPYTIRPGQELRLSRPPPRRRVAAATPRPERRAPGPPSGRETAEAPAPPQAETETRPSAQGPAAPSGSGRVVAGVRWRWPTSGAVQRAFDPAASRRGIAIGGREGQRVVAAAGGDVVYSGTGLIGYGELIIIKHSDTMLSAYGHNRRRLVEEGVRLEAGQAIAEMGRNERDEEILHFEIRRDGQPVDPLGFLPER